MSYALVRNNVIEAEQRFLPDSARSLADPGRWITGLPYQSVAIQRSTGWYAVVQTARPVDTATHTYDYSVSLISGIPTVVWTQRAKTQAELDYDVANQNATNLTQPSALQSKIDALKTFRADPQTAATLAQTNNTMPSASQLNQYNKASIRHQRRQDNLIIALARLLDPSLLLDISDTTGEA